MFVPISAYEYVQDTEEASDSVQSSVDAMSPRQIPDSDTEATEARRQMLEEMQQMQDRINAVFSGLCLTYYPGVLVI